MSLSFSGVSRVGMYLESERRLSELAWDISGLLTRIGNCRASTARAATLPSSSPTVESAVSGPVRGATGSGEAMTDVVAVAKAMDSATAALFIAVIMWLRAGDFRFIEERFNNTAVMCCRPCRPAARWHLILAIKVVAQRHSDFALFRRTTVSITTAEVALIDEEAASIKGPVEDVLAPQAQFPALFRIPDADIKIDRRERSNISVQDLVATWRRITYQSPYESLHVPDASRILGLQRHAELSGLVAISIGERTTTAAQ